MGEIRHFDFLWDLWFRFLGSVDNVWLVFHECPFKTLLRPIHVKAFPVLSCDIVKKSPYVRGQIAVFDFDMASFDRERVSRFFGDVIPNGSRSKTADVFCQPIDQAETGTDDVGGVVHRNHFFPVTWPAVHVLRVRRGQVLDLSDLALVVEIFDEKEFAAVDDCLCHHVFEPRRFDLLNNLLAFLDGGCHRDGAHHVLTSIERFERHPCVIGDRAIDMNKIDVRVSQNIVVIRVPLFDLKLVTNLVHFGFVATTNGRHVRVGVGLVNWDELCTKSQSNHCGIYRTTHLDSSILKELDIDVGTVPTELVNFGKKALLCHDILRTIIEIFYRLVN